MAYDDPDMTIKAKRDHVERASALVQTMAERCPEINAWSRASRPKVVRLAMERGLASLEAEFGCATVAGVGSGF